MATRAVLAAFERFQKERTAFVSTVAEMAKSPQVGQQRGCSMHGARCKPSPVLTQLPVRAGRLADGYCRPTRHKNIEALQQAGAMALLRPLLLDNVPRCQPRA